MNSGKTSGFVLLFMLAALAVAGCAGDGTGLDTNGQPIGTGGATDTVLTADFTSIQDHIFTPICTTCHAGGGAPQGLRLDSANSYTLLVGIASTEVPTILRVKPGDPDNSYLIQKLEGHAAVGARMPFGLPPLSTDQIAAIRQWITDGAQRPATGLGMPFTVTTTIPAANEILSTAPPQIVIGFNHELDATQINAQTVHLERLVGSSIDATFESVPATLSLPVSNPMSLVLTPTQGMSDGHFRLVMPAAAATISDNAGLALGTPALTENGDALIVEFDVEASR